MFMPTNSKLAGTPPSQTLSGHGVLPLIPPNWPSPGGGGGAGEGGGGGGGGGAGVGGGGEGGGLPPPAMLSPPPPPPPPIPHTAPATTAGVYILKSILHSALSSKYTIYLSSKYTIYPANLSSKYSAFIQRI